MPNFLIIGAAKAGTTSLYAWLKQHPQIYMVPVKETNFFAFEGEKLDFAEGSINQNYLAGFKTNIESYLQQFQGVSQEIAIGEASPTYLYYPRTSERIRHYIPNIKLIAILRNPVERAYSMFLHHRREGIEPFSNFAQALEAEETRIRHNWWWGFYYVQGGFYYTQLKRYFNKFDKSQIKIYLYQNLKANPNELLQDMFEFIGVDSSFVPDMDTKYNITGIPKNQFWHQLLSQPNFIKAALKPLVPKTFGQRITTSLRNRNLVKPKLPLSLQKELLQIYLQDILKLQDLIEQDLSSWLDYSD